MMMEEDGIKDKRHHRKTWLDDAKQDMKYFGQSGEKTKVQIKNQGAAC